jgi:hypothetical protein
MGVLPVPGRSCIHAVWELSEKCIGYVLILATMIVVPRARSILANVAVVMGRDRSEQLDATMSVLRTRSAVEQHSVPEIART